MSNIPLKSFLDIIRSINNGSVITADKDDNTQLPIPSDKITVFRQLLPNGVKYLFFSLYTNDGSEEFAATFSEIENVAIFQRDDWAQGEAIKASDSYLILFWHVPAIDTAVLKKVIELEDNEFYFKKYVFYYTTNEYEEFVKWYKDNRQKGSIVELLQGIETEFIKTPAIKFLTRLLIKVPCLTLPFQACELPNFDHLVDEQIRSIRDASVRENVNTVRRIITDLTQQGKTVEHIVKLLEADIERC